jgi:transmembrane sensor
MEERLRHLFKKYLENNCSRPELEEFFSFIHKAEHDEMLRQLIKKVYQNLKGDESNTTYVDENGRLILTEPKWLVPKPANVKTRKSRSLSGIFVAVVILVTAGVAWVLKTRELPKNKTTAIASLTKKVTDRSESKFLLLEDSTQVWLNAASSLEFPDQFSDTRREVFLSGEAYFDVKHAEKIPFIIHTGDVSTTVLGTAFNIKAYPGQTSITISVSRGKVTVSRKNNWLATLTKGQELKVKGDGQEIKEKNVPAENIAAWQRGNIVYDDETMEDIISDMERIYNTNIRIDNQSIHDLRISTSFKREIGIEQALQVLCKLTDTELEQTDGVYFIQ